MPQEFAAVDQLAPNGAPSDAIHVEHDVTCTWCSCMCDDLNVATAGERIVSAEHACELGRRWFLDEPPDREPCLIDGHPAPVEEGIARAAAILSAARSPLVYGFRHTSCETLQIGVDLAERLGGHLDTAVSVGHGSSIVAYHDIGKVCCTLGEIRQRGDLLICWGANPVESHPRFLQRSMPPFGRFLPTTEKPRTLVVVDVRRTPTAELADVFLQIRPGSDFEALWVLRALAAGIEMDAGEVEQSTGVPLDQWRGLMDQMKRAKFASLLYGMGVMRTRGEHSNVDALFALTRDMNDHTRFVCRSLKGQGNVVGADSVLAWRTGYPFAVNLARGYPRYNPGEYNAEALLTRGEVDATLVVATDAITDLNSRACAKLHDLPLVTVGSLPTALDARASVCFATCRAGIESGGTVYRMDEVPLRLRPVRGHPLPSETNLLASLFALIVKLSLHDSLTGFCRPPNLG